MDEEKLESKIKKAITKKAIGYQAKEVVEEYPYQKARYKKALPARYPSGKNAA